MVLVALVNDLKIVQYTVGILCMLVKKWFHYCMLKILALFLSQIENKDKADFKLAQTERNFKVAGSSKGKNHG